MLDFEKLTSEENDEDISVLDLGEFTNEKVEDSIVTSWNQLFNELVDEGENRIDRRFGSVRRKEDITNSATPIIQDFIQRIKESLGTNILKVEKYLNNYIKTNYAVQDSFCEEETNE